MKIQLLTLHPLKIILGSAILFGSIFFFNQESNAYVYKVYTGYAHPVRHIGSHYGKTSHRVTPVNPRHITRAMIVR